MYTFVLKNGNVLENNISLTAGTMHVKYSGFYFEWFHWDISVTNFLFCTILSNLVSFELAGSLLFSFSRLFIYIRNPFSPTDHHCWISNSLVMIMASLVTNHFPSVSGPSLPGFKLMSLLGRMSSLYVNQDILLLAYCHCLGINKFMSQVIILILVSLFLL